MNKLRLRFSALSLATRLTLLLVILVSAVAIGTVIRAVVADPGCYKGLIISPAVNNSAELNVCYHTVGS